MNYCSCYHDKDDEDWDGGLKWWMRMEMKMGMRKG